jgi:hypothetical protein
LLEDTEDVQVKFFTFHPGEVKLAQGGMNAIHTHIKEAQVLYVTSSSHYLNNMLKSALLILSTYAVATKADLAGRGDHLQKRTYGYRGAFRGYNNPYDCPPGGWGSGYSRGYGSQYGSAYGSSFNSLGSFNGYNNLNNAGMYNNLNNAGMYNNLNNAGMYNNFNNGGMYNSFNSFNNAASFAASNSNAYSSGFSAQL